MVWKVMRWWMLVLALAWSAQAQETFVYLAGQEIPVIDPAKHTDETSTQSIINLYDPLVYPKSREGLMEPGPHVAESWKADSRGRTFSFKIRKGIKFQDGSELTAEDVVFSMQRMLALKKGFSWLWLNILDPKDARVIDRYTVEFELKEPFSPFLSTLTQLFIVNKELILKNLKPGAFGNLGDYGEAYLTDKSAGSGPYKLVNYERSTVIEFARFNDYWRGWKAGQIERGVIRVNKEEATMRTLLTSGQVRMIDQWRTPATYEQLAKTSGVSVNERPAAQLFHIPLNTARPPLNDLRVRRAIVQAFDYDTALKQIFKGAIQAQGPVPLVGWEAYGISEKDLEKNGITLYKQNVEAAKKDLAAAGIKPGQLTLNYVYPEGGVVRWVCCCRATCNRWASS